MSTAGTDKINQCAEAVQKISRSQYNVLNPQHNFSKKHHEHSSAAATGCKPFQACAIYKQAMLLISLHLYKIYNKCHLFCSVGSLFITSAVKLHPYLYSKYVHQHQINWAYKKETLRTLNSLFHHKGPAHNLPFYFMLPLIKC